MLPMLSILYLIGRSPPIPKGYEFTSARMGILKNMVQAYNKREEIEAIKEKIQKKVEAVQEKTRIG